MVTGRWAKKTMITVVHLLVEVSACTKSLSFSDHRLSPELMHDNATTFHVLGIELLPSACAVAIQGELVSLTRSEFRVLRFLTSNAGIVFTRQQIIAAVHGPD